MTTFRDYLWECLCAEGYIDDEETSPADLDMNVLYTETDLDPEDVRAWHDEYQRLCADEGVEPDDDIDNWEY